MSKTNIAFEIDFNNLFNLNLSYSFEALKVALENFVQNQKESNTRISELEKLVKLLQEENM